MVLDSGVPGFGASTRNGGQIGSGNQKFRVKRLILYAAPVALLREGTRMLDYIEDLSPGKRSTAISGAAGAFAGRCGRLITRPWRATWRT